MVKRVLAALYFILGVVSVASAQPPNSWINPVQIYFKIPVAKDGIYRLTYADLLNGGFPVNSVDPRFIQVFHRGREQAVFFRHLQTPADAKFDDGEFLEFFGQRNDGTRDAELYRPSTAQPHQYYNLYSDTTAYFLTWNTLPVQGKRVTQFSEVNVNSLPAESSHTATVLSLFTSQYSGGTIEAEYIQQSYYNEGEGWTGPVICTQSSGCTGQQDFVLEGLVGRVTAAPLPVGEIQLVGRDDLTHVAEIYAGQNTGSLRLVATTTFQDFATSTIRFNLAWSDIAGNGRITVRVKALGAAGVRDRLSVNFIRVDFAQNFDMAGLAERQFQLAPRSGGKSYVEFANAPAGARLWDVTDPTAITVIGLSPSGTTQRAIVPNTNSSRRLLLTNQFTTPAFERVAFRNFVGASPDYLIISHRALRQPALGYDDPVKAYASYRASDEGGGYDTLMVTMDQLYNQFNYGETSPLAIYEFVEYLYGGGRLKYLFLMGKGREVFSGLHRLANMPANEFRDLVPSAGFPASDLLYSAGLQGEEHVPAISTGRLSASTPAQVAAYLNKIKDSESATYSDRWHKKVLHLSGGIQQQELSLFRQFMDGFAAVAEGQFYGGSVTTLRKNQPTAIELINISEEINEGVNLVTFFGHSGPNATDIDIGYATDPAMGYNNPERYPAFLVNGCSAGDFFSNYNNFGEDWILAANKGARSFIANTSNGYANQLKYYTDLFYESAFADSAGLRSGVGDVQRAVVEKYIRASNAFSSVALNHQMFLLGDPAVKLFGAGKPDFDASSVSSIGFDAQPVTAAADSFRIKVVVKNFGLTTSQPLPVRITQTFSDNTSAVHEALLAQPLFEDTLNITIRRTASRSLANNQFTVVLDPDNTIDELNKLNNTATYTLVVPGTRNLFPHDFGIVATTSVDLVFVNADLLTTSAAYELEVDSVSSFDSPFAKRATLTAQALARYQLEIPGRDSTVYFWRTRLASGDAANWQNSSFAYIKDGQEGWTQLNFNQFTQNSLEGLVPEPSVQLLDYEQSSADIFVRTFGSGNPATPSNAALRIDGVDYWTSIQGFNCRDNTLNLVAFNKNTVVPYKAIPFTFQNSFGRACGREPQIINSFRVNEVVTGNGDDLIAYIDNVGAGDSVILFTMGAAGFESFPTAAKNKMQELGIAAAQLDELESGEPVIILGRKGLSPGAARFIRSPLLPAADQEVSYDGAVTGRFASGAMKSVTVGPALQWQAFQAATAAQPNDDWTFDLYGLRADGTQALLGTDIGLEEDLTTISAEEFPFLRIAFTTNDDADLTPAQVKNWFVFYESVPEGILQFKGPAEPVTFQEGLRWTGQYVFHNISEKSFPDSLAVEASIYNKTTPNTWASTFKIKAPAPGDSTTFSVTNSPSAGTNEVALFVNRRIAPELYYENNNLTLADYLLVQPDAVSPVLEVTVDGRFLANGDYVSPNPSIKVRLIDENVYRVKADTIGVNILMKEPCASANCTFQRVVLNSEDINWIPATAQQDFTLTYSPKNLEDGEYTLRIQVPDATGNESTQPYEITFRVLQETTINLLAPHPNPSSDSFIFPVTITGSQQLNYLRLNIYNTNGRLVNHYTADNLIGHVGTNYLQWDGKTADGGRANAGVYIYQLTIGVNETRKTVTGKIVFLP